MEDRYYVDMLHPRYEMPFHWHMECELLLVLQGEFTLLTDGQSYTLHPGNSAFLSSGAVHGGIPKDCVYECLVFDLNHLLKDYFRQLWKMPNRQECIHYYINHCLEKMLKSKWQLQ